MDLIMEQPEINNTQTNNIINNFNYHYTIQMNISPSQLYIIISILYATAGIFGVALSLSAVYIPTFLAFIFFSLLAVYTENNKIKNNV